MKCAAAEIERLQEAKRRALKVADERSKENVGLRADLDLTKDLLRKALDSHYDLRHEGRPAEQEQKR